MRSVLSWLIVGLPVALGSRLLHGPELLTFCAAALSLIPLAGWIGAGTEHLAARLGSSAGGLLNATFGNAAELIITILALRNGLVDLVKASITGSILGNTLLILGMSAMIGGGKHGVQRFEAASAGRHSVMMLLAVSGLALAAVLSTVVKDSFVREEASVGVSILLLLTYAAYIRYSFFSKESAEAPKSAAHEGEAPEATWSVGKAIGLLAAAVVGTVVGSEVLVHSVEGVTTALGLSHFFIGLIVIPLIGNVAEHYSAIDFAARNKIDLSLSIAANSSTQIAVFVAPLLVLVSLFFHPMDLLFTPTELVMLFASSTVFAYVSLDGETNWFEGVQLTALYLIAAVIAFFTPG